MKGTGQHRASRKQPLLHTEQVAGQPQGRSGGFREETKTLDPSQESNHESSVVHSIGRSLRWLSYPGSLAIILPHCLAIRGHRSREQSLHLKDGYNVYYGLDDRGNVVRFPAKVRDFSPLRSLRTGPGAHPASYSMGTGVSFPGGNAAEAWSWPSISF
jgi:hypothetical protein